jgi:hypothetical protein
MKKQFNVGDLFIWTIDSIPDIAYITEIGNDESISIVYLDEPREYYYTITQLSDYIFTKQLLHYPVKIQSKTFKE